MSCDPAASVDAAAAFLRACELDVLVVKPGNVSTGSPMHDMSAAMFVASAHAAVAPLVRIGAPVGRRIEEAIAATRVVVDCNTNLGIVLLCAPLAAALERLDRSTIGVEPWQRATREVLASLDVDDARAAYRAIALAQPAGLGAVAEQDVVAEPSLDLRRAMALARERDRIARQYACDFEDVFGFAVPTLLRMQDGEPWRDLEAAVQALFIVLLAQWPDSHIVRKYGADMAQTVTQQARRWRSLALEGALGDHAGQLAAWDSSLKRHRLNPGTTADLTVATVFAAACIDPRLLASTESDPAQRRL